jgi:5'-3' exonuclease
MNLAIDGNYILNRNVFPLIKDKLLYGSLLDSLEKSVSTYSKWYPFKNIYFVSDSRGNWRKNIYPEYKGNRKKDDSIDWEFIYETYTEFKGNLSKRYKVLEVDLVEGDDWFYHLCKHHNKKDESILMVSNDGDLQQLIRTEKNCVNLMVNENHRYNNIFLPNNYSTWKSHRYDTLPLPGLFDDYSEDYGL